MKVTPSLPGSCPGIGVPAGWHSHQSTCMTSPADSNRRQRWWTVDRNIPTLGIPASSGAGGCQYWHQDCGEERPTVCLCLTGTVKVDRNTTRKCSAQSTHRSTSIMILVVIEQWASMTKIDCPICGRPFFMGLPTDATIEAVERFPNRNRAESQHAKTRKARCRSGHKLYVTFSITAQSVGIG